MKELIFFNSIYVLQSLRKTELQTGETLFNDLIKRKVDQMNGFQANFFKLENKAAFHSCLSEIIEKVNYGLERPYLHFEVHGCKEGLVFNSGEILTWAELYQYFVLINKPLQNQLFVSLATCFGAYIINAIEPTKKSPFYAFVGPTREVSNSAVEVGFYEYFDVLLNTNDFNEAIEALNSANPGLPVPFICKSSEEVFDQACNLFLKRHENKDFRRKRVQELIDRARKNPILKVKFSKAEMRTHFSKLLKSRYQANGIKELKKHFLFHVDYVEGLTS
ncbi:hypothetical protein [Pedobacter ginsengiterrae]